MTIRIDDESPELTKAIEALDAELSSIQYEERPSFGPELEAELAREWARMRHEDTPVAYGRRIMAAAAAVVLLAFAGVPTARASLVRFIGSFDESPVAEESAPTQLPGAEAFQAAPIEPLLTTEPVERTTPTRIPLERPQGFVEDQPFEFAPPTLPEIDDRGRTQALIRRHYPTELERLGVGGSVRLLLWVDEQGGVDNVNMKAGSGIPGLDRAAMRDIAPSLRFRPATMRGEAVGTWVEFDVVFEPDPPPEMVPEEIPDPLPAIDLPSGLDMEPLDLALIPEWEGEVELVAPVQREAGELLLAALGSEEELERFGSIDAILAGDPPSGVTPTQWRADVSTALEEAMARAPDNPAPLLALARIRRKQGLRTEARVLFERGLQRAIRAGESVTPTLLAELHYERGTLIKESWLSQRELGRVPANRFDPSACPAARSSGGATTGYASEDRLIAWNYLCPAELGRIMADGFEPAAQSGADRTVMLASFRAAVEADPKHPGANVELLLSLADEGRWDETLSGARRFVRASGGHPYGLLIGGLALHRLSRTEDADGQFRLALRGLPEAEVEDLLDLSLLLDGSLLDEYLREGEEGRRDWEGRFWSPLDPILSTPVNERAVEHLARASYSKLRFGDAHGDPAEVWIRYGRPSAVRVTGERAGIRTEFWDYGLGPDITFARMGTSARMDLTPEGRAYVDDLREVLPHRYGVSSRTVFSLPGQVTRFLTGDGGALEFDIYTRVPELLATGAADTLDLGVFFVDGEGSRSRLTTRMIRAEQKPVALRIPLARESGTVVVELYNRTTGQAAALREPVSPLKTLQGASLSDVMVVNSATPDRGDVARSAEWVKPLELAESVESETVGAYFEMYTGLPEGPTSYSLSAEIVDRDSGSVTVVPIRPAGEEGFREQWQRTPTQVGAVNEFVTVALTDVPAGRHILRIRVDLHDLGTVLVSERDLEAREDD